MHKAIKRFCIDGQFIDDSKALSIRDLNERTLDVQMRDRGYVRALDMDPVWTVEYVSDKDEWFFKMSIYGIYVGKKKSWQYEGIQQGKLLPRSTHQAKLNQS